MVEMKDKKCGFYISLDTAEKADAAKKKGWKIWEERDPPGATAVSLIATHEEIDQFCENENIHDQFGELWPEFQRFLSLAKSRRRDTEALSQELHARMQPLPHHAILEQRATLAFENVEVPYRIVQLNEVLRIALANCKDLPYWLQKDLENFNYERNRLVHDLVTLQPSDIEKAVTILRNEAKCQHLLKQETWHYLETHADLLWTAVEEEKQSVCLRMFYAVISSLNLKLCSTSSLKEIKLPLQLCHISGKDCTTIGKEFKNNVADIINRVFGSPSSVGFDKSRINVDQFRSCLQRLKAFASTSTGIRHNVLSVVEEMTWTILEYNAPRIISYCAPCGEQSDVSSSNSNTKTVASEADGGEVVIIINDSGEEDDDDYFTIVVDDEKQDLL